MKIKNTKLYEFFYTKMKKFLYGEELSLTENNTTVLHYMLSALFSLKKHIKDPRVIFELNSTAFALNIEKAMLNICHYS